MLTANRTTTLPRVNLLPPEIAEARNFRRVQVGLGATVVVAAAVVVALVVQAKVDVAHAQEGLGAVQSRTTVLRTQVAQYDDVPVVYAQVATAKAQLELAMGQEVRWSHYVSDIARRTPDTVWLTGLTVVPSGAGVASGTPGTSALSTPGIGTVTFTGRATKHNDVATWLDSVAREKGFADPYFTTSGVKPLGGSNIVEFSSSVTLTADALSGRYTAKAGN